MCDCDKPLHKIKSDLTLICKICNEVYLLREPSESTSAFYRWVVNGFISISRDNQKRIKTQEKAIGGIVKLQKQIILTLGNITALDPSDQKALEHIIALVVPMDDLTQYGDLVKESMELTKNVSPVLPTKAHNTPCPYQGSGGPNLIVSKDECVIICPECPTTFSVQPDLMSVIVDNLQEEEEILSNYTFGGQPYSPQMKNAALLQVWAYLGSKMMLGKFDMEYFGMKWLNINEIKYVAKSHYFTQ